MSFSDNYWELKKKKKNQTQKASGNSLSDHYFNLREEDIAPVRERTKTVSAPVKKKEDDGLQFFQKGAFEDGYQAGDVTKAILGTAGDLGVGVIKGGAKMVGGIIDAGTYGVAGIADAFGADDLAGDLRKKAQENVIDDAFKYVDDDLDKYSVLGRTSDSIAEGLGQVGSIILTGGIAGAAGLGVGATTAITTGAMGVSSVGSGLTEAYAGGATDEEAAAYGLIKGVVDAGSELIFGGLGKTVKALGVSKGLSSLDDVFAQKLAGKITNQVAKNFAEFGVKASAEGVEEVLAGLGTAVAKKLTYMDDKDLKQLVKDENLLEQFVVGAVTSGIAQSGIVPGMKGGSLREANKTGRDFISGLTENEQKVVDKVYKDRVSEREKSGKLSSKEKNRIYDNVLTDLEEGGISIDTIEEVLGGDRYKEYKAVSEREDAVKQEHDILNRIRQSDMTGEQIDRLAELKEQIKTFEETNERNTLKDRMSQEVFGLAKDSKLAESYNERARRSQAFTADLTQYDSKQQEVVKRAEESGILNNTKRTHKFVDMVAKISADKGVLFDFANNEKLKESGFAMEGKTVNGFVTKDGVTLNIDSAKALNTVVGHEITHVLEGTELYTELQSIMKSYAETKGEYERRRTELAELYKDIQDADIDAELTADLVGDYLFTDADFINSLSTNHRNVFQKIYDEVKYLCKVATAGSKEARELEKVKRAFEKAYREVEQTIQKEEYSDTNSDGNPIDPARISDNEIDTRYSLSHNPEIAKGQSDYVLNKKSYITAEELEKAQEVTNAMVDVMMKYSSILPEDKIGKVLTNNGSYDRSVENTTICVRTLAYNEFVDKVQEEVGRPLTQMESFLVSQKLYDIAVEPQCLYCYVSLDRKAFNDMLLRYMQDRDTVIAKYNNSDKSPAAIDALYEEFLHGRKPTKEMKSRFDAWISYVDNGTQLLSLADIATEDRQSVIKANGGNLATQLADARKYAQSASWSKIQKSYVAYRDEILKLGDRVVKNLNEHYGLRWYSFSDYSAAFIVENMQQITDASIRGLKGLAYTKDTDFAEIFAPSGMNINVSVFVNQDKDGNFCIDEKQSANFEKALELRERYPNVGIVATVTNDDALRWAGSQEWSDVIIPFHIVRTGTDVAEYYKWLNYTSESADTIKDKDIWNSYLDSLNLKSDNARKKVSKNIYPNEHKNDKATYLNLCESRGLSPRFVRFAGEDWYMKLVNETRLSADASSPLKPVYNEDAAKQSFQKFVNKGGYEGGWYKDVINVDAEAKAVAQDVIAGKKANEVSYGRQDGFSPESMIANRKANRTHGLYSLGNGNDRRTFGNYNVYGKDIALNANPNTENALESELPAAESELFQDDLAPTMDDNPGRIDSMTDEDAPQEMDAPYYGESADVDVDDPFENRDMDEVGKRNVKAYMYENPEVKPFFQEEANVMLGELRNSIKGDRWYNDELYYESGGEYGWSGTKRYTSDDIAYLLDNVPGTTYDKIEKALNAIIEDNGKENNALSKRIEFLINDRLMNGYKGFMDGMEYPPNQDYLKLLKEKQITEYSKEAFDALMEQEQEYAPAAEENLAPVSEAAGRDISPVPEQTDAAADKQPGNTMEAAAEREQIARILDEEPTPANRKSRLWARFRANVLDKGSVFEDLSLKRKNRELMGKWNYILSSDARAQRLMGNGAEGVKSLNAIREEVGSTGKTKDFYEYLYHRHNIDRMSLETEENRTRREGLKKQLEGFSDTQIESMAMQWITKDTPEDVKKRIQNAREYVDTLKGKNKPVFGETVTADISREVVRQFEGKNPEFKAYAQDVYDYMNHLRDMMVEGGVISRETADLWAKMYPHYVPIRRAGQKGLAVNVPLDTGRTGVNAPIKRATGGSSDILPLFDTMAIRTNQTFKAIAKNRFGVELKNTLGSSIDSGEIGVDEIIDSVENQGELLKKGENGRDHTFTVFEDGKRVTFDITEDMYDALKPSADWVSGKIPVLGTASNFHRGLLTEYNPVFMLTNAIKDAQDVLINSQHAARTYSKMPEAFAQVLSKGYWYNEYMDNGGEQNTYFDSRTNTFQTENKGLSKILELPPFSTISALNNYIEMTPRLAEYIASRESGRSVEVSMLDAARVTTNFQAGGDVTRFLNRNGATFLNASVQGAMQQVRNVREAKANGLKGYVNLAAKFAIAGLPAIILNNLVWDDDKEYEELSDYVKQNYYVVGKYDDGKFIRIPKGRTLAVIQNAFEQVSNALTGDDELDLATFLELAVSNLAPNNPIDNNILAPIIQAVNNKTWYGDDLVPTRLQKLPNAEQFDETTDAFSKWLGEKTDISPYKINYLLNQYGGGAGDVVLPMLTPKAESGDNSILGNILAPMKDKFTTDSVLKNQNVSDFYDTMDKLAVNANSSKATDEDVLKYKYMNSVNADLAELYKQKREIQNSGMPDDQKYEAVRDIQKQIADLAEESLSSYQDVSYEDDYREGGEYARVRDRIYRKDKDGEWQKLSDEQATKYEVTKAAGDADYATDGTNHYRWYIPGEDAGEDAVPHWKKISDDELEKQREVSKGLGVSPETYWGNKDEYDFTYKSPGKYGIAKAVGGYQSYKGYSGELYDIKADKDENGKSISGSRKEKVIEYINNLDADYGEKIVLFKSEYPADDTYNYDIIDYLNGRDDISYSEMETILKELGFTVDANGNISW